MSGRSGGAQQAEQEGRAVGRSVVGRPAGRSAAVGRPAAGGRPGQTVGRPSVGRPAPGARVATLQPRLQRARPAAPPEARRVRRRLVMMITFPVRCWSPREPSPGRARPGVGGWGWWGLWWLVVRRAREGPVVGLEGGRGWGWCWFARVSTDGTAREHGTVSTVSTQGR